MSVHAQIGTLISLVQSSVRVKPTKNTPHLLPLGIPYLRDIGSIYLSSGLIFAPKYLGVFSDIYSVFHNRLL
ncbi:hypothetical protein MXB_4940 [Myxobolus squamalis]|nr:hypothetical protein MXB_4940 [Myxobolus squamalis]